MSAGLFRLYKVSAEISHRVHPQKSKPSLITNIGYTTLNLESLTLEDAGMLAQIKDLKNLTKISLSMGSLT